MDPDEITPGTEPIARNFVGSVVRFYLRRKAGETLEKGEVTSQRWLGLTAKGRIPE